MFHGPARKAQDGAPTGAPERGCYRSWFSLASDGDFEAVQATAAEIRQPIIAALARANRQDIERAWEAVKKAAHPRLHTFIATSDIHLEFKLRKSRSEVLEQSIEAVKIARDLCSDVEFLPKMPPEATSITWRKSSKRPSKTGQQPSIYLTP